MHSHTGPASTSAYLAGCRDSRCIRAWGNYQRLRHVAKATVALPEASVVIARQPVIPEPVMVTQPPPAVSEPVAFPVPQVTQPVVAERGPVLAQIPDDARLGDLPPGSPPPSDNPIFDAVRVLRLTAGANT